MSGNIELDGINISVESNAYIESEDTILALSITGNSQIAGDVKIVNPLATVDLQGGQAKIGGESGQDAIDNHVKFGVPPTEFPQPNPSCFESYITNIMDPNTDTSTDLTIVNTRIPAHTNLTFSGHATLKGVIFIESPNIVTFAGTTDLTAIIVGDGDWTDNSATNHISFLGDVTSTPVSELPCDEQFDGLREDAGTFIMAPGFYITVASSFTALSGAIAGNGIEFNSSAGSVINGSILNYSNDEMILSGNNDLYFNRSGLDEVPAGFVPEIILKYDNDSYYEIM